MQDRLFAWTWLAVLLLSGMMTDTNTISAASGRVNCEIRATRNDAGTTLDAIIRATGAVTGTYMLKLRKGVSGEVTSHSGTFEIDSASPTEIRKASIPLAPGEAYTASLTVKWPNGSSSCSASGR